MSRMPHCSAIVSSAVNLQKSALVIWKSRPVGGPDHNHRATQREE